MTSPREVVAVVRLVVSGQGQVLYGDAIDVETESHRRFRGWAGLRDAIRGLVTAAVADAGDGPGEPEPGPGRKDA